MRSVFIPLLMCLVGGPATAGTLLVLGDSLSAGHGLAPGQGWVALLQQRLEQQEPSWHVVNASISGDTTAGGLARLPVALERHQPDVVLLELGANDGLRGLSLSAMQDNLEAMITTAQAADARVLLIGMHLPPNYGPRYTGHFSAIYRELATRHGLPLVPFLLERVALDPGLMLSDNLHPNAAGQPLLLDTVWPVLQPLLDTAGMHTADKTTQAAESAEK